VGLGRREAFGVRQLAAALSLCPNSVPVPIWPQRMQWALAAAKRLECGSLLPLCLYAQTTCLSPYRHPSGSSADFGSRRLKQGTICGPRRDHGAKPKQRACHFTCVVLDMRGRQAPCTESIHFPLHSFAKERSGRKEAHSSPEISPPDRTNKPKASFR